MAAFKQTSASGKTTWTAKFYYKDWQGQSKQKKKEGFTTKREAQDFERDFLDKVNSKSDMFFSSLYAHYYEYCERRLKPTTLANKKVLIELKILPYFRDMTLNSIEVSTVMKWQNELMSQGYAETYLKTIHNQLSAMFNFATKYYKLGSNPARLCGSMGKKNAEAMRFYTVDEFNSFIGTFNEKPMSKLMLELLFWTGIRSGELLALTVSDFDFESHIMSISKNYARHNREDLILIPKTPKSKRIIALPESLSASVKDYSTKLYGLEPTDRLFTVTKSLLNLEMKRGSEKSGLKKIRVHDLRHSHASLLIEMGFSPLLIAERLGHERVETTLETYSHLYPHKQTEVAAQLQKLREL